MRDHAIPPHRQPPPHLEEAPVLAVVQALQERRQVWHAADDREHLGAVDDLGLERRAVEGDDGRQHRVGDAARVVKQLGAAQGVS